VVVIGKVCDKFVCCE